MGCSDTLPSLFVVFFFLRLVAASHGEDTLTQGQSLKEGETLVSQSQVFELGFFTPPGGDPSRRYVGIWYYGLPSKAVIWIANRNDPLIGAPGSLAMASDGNLVVLDGGGKQRWTTNCTVPSNSSSLQLMDSGNLFLNTSDGRTVLWQSFEHPTDTFIPGMKVALDRRTQRGVRFRSWRSAADPAEGDYSLGLDPRLSGQIFTWRGAAPYWRSGQLIAGMFDGIKWRALSNYGWILDPGSDQGKMVLNFRPFNSSLYRFVLQPDGSLNISMLVGATKQWNPLLAEPRSRCDVYNTCGNNSRCADAGEGGGGQACECLRGFVPASEAEWREGNWSGGCVRRTPLKCERNGTAGGEVEDDGFWVVSGVKLPDLSEWASTIGDAEGCRRSCLGSCSCAAYAYVKDGGGCFTWSTALVDIRQFSGDGDNDLHVKLAGSELATKDKIWIVILVISLLVVIVVLLIFYLWWTYRAKIKDWWKKSRKIEELLSDLGNGRDVLPESMNPTEFVDQTKDGKSAELPLFSFGSIAAATGCFSESNKLGQGGFGHVYKGILPGGREVAVKRLSETSGQGQEEFKNEVRLIAKLQHRNLVRLMGCCTEGDERILIYEYLPNKSLDAFIFNPSMRPLLDWGKRFNIIEGIARGLLYLHRDSRLRIIHRDLKASNILLDEEMNPKISDFGMARIFGGNQNHANTTRVVGTFGYMSPEYAMEGLFSIKSDVYSFGVLMLEIISGQRNNSFHRTEKSPNLVGHAWQLWNEDRSLELVDPSIRSSISTREVMRCIQVGLLCVQDRASDRPTMSSVVFMLGNEAILHPMPKQPTFTLEGSPTETESLAQDCETLTRSDVTVTVVTGR